jgi:hypothetical protein
LQIFNDQNLMQTDNVLKVLLHVYSTKNPSVDNPLFFSKVLFLYQTCNGLVFKFLEDHNTMKNHVLCNLSYATKKCPLELVCNDATKKCLL